MVYTYLQNEENSKWTERVRKHAAQVQRQQRGGAAARKPRRCLCFPAPDIPPANAEDEDNAHAVPAGDVSAAPAGDAPAAPGSAAPAGVRPPDRWSDDHMHWRHPLAFVFSLNGPLAFWHPHIGSRNVCEFLKKTPRSGPQDCVRGVSQNDNRRSQRRGDREVERSQSASRQDDILHSLRDSRDTMASAAQEANHLTRLQLQFQVAQHAGANSTAHLVAAQTALNIVNTIPASSLDAVQAKKKRRMERSLAKACLEVSVVPAPNPFAFILAELSSPSFRCMRACYCFLFTGHTHICRMVPIVSSDAANAEPVSGRANAPTVPRRMNGGAVGGGSAARASSQNLQPLFDANA
jgi:hypothetical protein